MRSALPQWLIPGLAVVLFLVSLPELFTAGNSFLTDPATARHLRSGELMLQQREILSVDPFGCDIPPRPWIAFEWLFEITTAALVRAGGLPLAYVVGFLLFALLPVLLWNLLRQQSISIPVAFGYALAASLLFRSHHLLRPVIVTYLLMTVVVTAWYRHPEGPRKWLWFLLPALFALWANIHGGFVAALLFLGLSWLGRLIDRRISGQASFDPGTLAWLPLLIICANATLLTPHGWALHRLIWDMVFHIKSFAQWNEFRAPALWPPSALGFAALIIGSILLLGFITGDRRLRRWETALPLLLFLYFAFTVQRHIMLLAIVAAVPVCHVVDGWLNRLWSPPRRQRLDAFSAIDSQNRSALWMIPFAALVAATLFMRSPAANSLRVGTKNISPEAIEFIRSHRSQFQRPLVTTWNAGALVYHLAPDFRITYDDRTEFYGDARLIPYIALLNLQPGWEETLAAGKFDSIILDHDFPLANALRTHPHWRLVYEDSLTLIFLPQ